MANVRKSLGSIRPLSMFYFNTFKTNVPAVLLMENVLNVAQQLDKADVTNHANKQ